MSDRKPVVMVAEADPDQRWLYQRWLVEAGWYARVVGDGAWALALIPPDPPDLVLLEWGLDEVDGLEVCRRLKADPALCHLPVVIMSVRADPLSQQQAQAAGADAFLAKPFGRTELILRLAGLGPVDPPGDSNQELELVMATALGRAGR